MKLNYHNMLTSVFVAGVIVGCGQAQNTHRIQQAAPTDEAGNQSSKTAADVDPSTGPFSLPSKNYVTTPCAPVEFTPLTTPSQRVSIDSTRYTSVEEVASFAPLVFVAEVTEVGSPLHLVPSNLPDAYRKEHGLLDTGSRDAPFAASELTPVRTKVLSNVVGEVPETVTFGELGCIPVGLLPSTTPGTRLLIFAEPITDGVGPHDALGTTHQLIDWMVITDDNTLGARASVLGIPNYADFLLDMPLDDAIAAIQQGYGASK